MTIRQKISQFVAYNRTVRELSKLSSTQLKDLGLNRDTIKDAARASVL